MRNLFETILGRDRHVCPWWCCFTFDNPLRKLFHDPIRILGPYIREGFTAVDIGPGMGYFTIPMCKLAGPAGKVIAIDIQKKMLSGLRKRAARAGISEQLQTILSTPEGFTLDAKADFVLAFWMVHEVPDQSKFLQDIHGLLKPKGQCLVVEPKLHVTERAFNRTIEAASEAGMRKKEFPKVALSRAVLLQLAQEPARK
jgi:ubiquinone/menaquinone biosynthesis C-methylase UbiE